VQHFAQTQELVKAKNDKD